MKRFRRPLMFAALGLIALVAIGLIVRAVANWRASVRLEEKIAALRTAGEPVSLADLARKPIPPESNAAVFLRRAKNELEAIEKEILPAYDAASEADQRAYDEGRPSEAMQRAIRAAFKAYPNAIGLLEQAAECPDYDPQLDFTLDTHSFIDAILANCHNSRTANRVLRYRVSLLLADGKHDEALSTCLVMFRLCRHFDRTPTVVGMLVAIAVRGVTVDAVNLVLRTGPILDASRDALDEELVQHDLVEQYRRGLKTERALGLEIFRELAAGREFADFDSSTWRGKGPSSWGAAGFKNDECSYLDYISEQIAVADRPYSEAIESPAVMRARAAASPLAEFIAGDTQAVQCALIHSQAGIRCLRVLNAIQRREQSGAAGEPKLTDLGLPADVTMDPFNGQPLHLKKLPGGWLIYSVDRNLRDDGGNIAEFDDFGFGPLEAAENDKPPPKSDESSP